MKKLLISGSAMALVMLFALCSACTQQTVRSEAAQPASPTSQTQLQAGSEEQEQQGGSYCPSCDSQEDGYEESGMGYGGYGMGPGMMGGYRMGPGMMGGMMGGGYETGPGGSRSNSQENPGLAIFDANCSSCHPGGGNSFYPNLPVSGAPQLVNFETFLAFLRNPLMPDGSRGPMPSFPASRISDEQAHELYQFILEAEQSGQTR